MKKTSSNHQFFQSEDYDYLVKIVIIGDTAVGKTNIMMKYCDNQFKDSYMATLGVDFQFKTVRCEDKLIKMQLWDTAGQERFKTITQNFYQGACAVVLCYSIDNQNSYQHIEKWIDQVNQFASPNVVKFILANKCDLDQSNINARTVSKEQGFYFQQQHGIPLREVSAKTGENIKEAFEDIVDNIKKNILDNDALAVKAIKPDQFLRLKKQYVQEKQRRCRC